MALQLVIKIDKDKHGGGPCLLETDGYTAKSGSVLGMAADKIPLAMYWRTVGNQTSTRYAVTASMVSFSSDYIPAAAIASFSDAGSGDDAYVSGILDLTSLTSALVTLLNDNGEQEVQLDFAVVETSGQRLSYRVPMLVRKQASATGGPVVLTGITITQPGGPGTPIVITGSDREIQL